MSQHFDEILINYLTGSVSDNEREEVLKWIRENPDNHKYFNELQKIYHLTKIIHKSSGYNKVTGWERIKAGYYQQRYTSYVKENRIKLRRIYWKIAAAAVIFMAVLIGTIFIRPGSKSFPVADQNVYNEIIAPLGSRSQVTLSDGTSVWLNAGSKLRYPARFVDDGREVSLEGEAFFDVTESKKIFVVKTSDVIIKVYGTRFNVKSYADEDEIETTLVEGSLSVEPIRDMNHLKPVVLRPNQKVTYIKSTQNQLVTKEKNPETIDENIVIEDNSGEIVITPKVDPVPITSWKDKEWVFESEPLDELAVKLERRYNVEITFEDEYLKNYRFTGTFKDETFEQLLGALQFGAPVLYTIEKNKVTFKEDPVYKKRYDSMISNPD